MPSRKQKARGPEKFFPVLEISAKSHFEFGLKLGQAAKVQIRLGLSRREKWLCKLKKFADEKPGLRVAPFIAALDLHFPGYLEELIGIARGAEVDFDILLLLNLNPELNAMMLCAREENCSTVMSRRKDHIILGHNEDGSEQYLGLMFLVAAELPDGNQCLTLCYPGVIPGNGPSINNRGIIHTCNYIGGKEWRHGVPRYFLDRAMLDARDMDDALGFAAHPFRTYSQAHNLVSIPEKRAVMVENSVNKLTVRELDGVFTRTNHYLFPEMATEPEFNAYPKKSGPRLDALKKALGKTMSGEISAAQARAALSSHRNRPLSPCRHRNPEVKGATLGMFLLDSDVPGLRFYYGAPCRKISRKFQPAWARWTIAP